MPKTPPISLPLSLPIFPREEERALTLGVKRARPQEIREPQPEPQRQHLRNRKRGSLGRRNLEPSIQRIVRMLKEMIPPTDESTTNTVRLQYLKVLNEGKEGSCSQAQWYARWHDAYMLARAHNIPEIQGPLAVRQFLLTIAHRMDPMWAQRELTEIARTEALGLPVTPLESYGKWYSTILYQREQLDLEGLSNEAPLATGEVQ
ncbi:hypothetical protein DL766_008185 [Monosporascus sp. MC13-8B]|uniref:Uncharacterized protein n=1 Tax=Monosporascus cannonballus TaxID=155416 RepID=A0ABY0HHH9_9PEZI|nr:hypothetical protein DL762_002580 [Monosporascus cannonballus]RYO98331.1 hypothetical protein DL763_002273 [Monosporascus cannonballus]RYP20495.1 hypothetical protein DL766_008185 [Monosporascus sp. MC13-8B]